MYNIFFRSTFGTLECATLSNLADAIAAHNRLATIGFEILTEYPH